MCMQAKVYAISDFEGLGSCADYASFTDELPEKDISFLDECVIPVSAVWGSHHAKRQKCDPSPCVLPPAIALPVAAINIAAAGAASAAKERNTPWKGPVAETALICRSISGYKESKDFVEKARIGAIVGSCPKSLPSVVSGIRCWCAFATKALLLGGRELPPTVDGLVAWSSCFRCARTYQNYINHVRIGCEIMRVSSVATQSPIVKKAKVAIEKRGNFTRREPMFLGRDLTTKVMRLARREADTTEAMLYLAAFIFLLRVPSEGIPMCRGVVGFSAQGPRAQSVLTKSGNEVSLHLACRKNKPRGSCIIRKCWCNLWPLTCPVHVLWPFVENLPEGSQPFSLLSMSAVLANLRRRLAMAGVENAALFRTHDFRRGHARDLLNSGGKLFEILEAGEWRSPAFLKYINTCELERDVVLQAHLDDSSEDES